MYQVSFMALLLYFVLTVFLNSVNTFCQESEYINTILELAEDEDAENVDWLEYLWELRENPLNLNEADISDLTRIPFLPPSLSRRIITYRDKHGQIGSLEELLELDGMSSEMIEALRPFAVVEKTSVKHFIYRLKFKREFPNRRGFEEGIYSGPYYLQHRLIFQIGKKYAGGILWEKDPGEENLFDYGSYHIRYRDPGDRWSVLAGDYQLRAGCGLMLWSPYGLPLSAAAVPFLPETSSPLSGNRSSSENGFLRGAALNFKSIWFDGLTLYYSHRKLDATFSPEGEVIRSLYNSGLHRTANEKNKIGILDEELYGVILNKQLAFAGFQIGALQSHLHPGYRDQGPSQNHVSLSYTATGGAVKPAGEIVLYQGKFPAVQQFLYFSTDRIKYEIAGYYYHPRYLALRGRALGSLSRSPGNRAGASLLFYFKPVPHTALSGYVHLYRTLYDSESNPFTRRDFFLEARRKVFNQWFAVQYRQKYRENDIDTATEWEKRIHQLRLEVKLDVHRKLDMRTRLEIHWAKPLEPLQRFYGFSLFHQVQWHLQKGFRLITRWTHFHVPDFDLAIYEYEPDLPGSFRTVMLNGRGYKWLFLLRWKPSPVWQFDLKYQQRFYPDQEVYGSGLDRLETNRIHDLRLAIIWRY